MDIQQIWQSIDGGAQQQTISDLSLKKAIGKKGRAPMEKLKYKLKLSVWMVVAITLFYFILLYFIPVFYLRTGVFILIIFNGFVGVQTWVLYSNIDGNLSPENPLRIELERNYQSIIRWWALQKQISIFVYPVSVLFGFMTGLWTAEPQKFLLIIQKPVIWIVALVLTAVMVPVCVYVADRLMDFFYGEQLRYLKRMIDLLAE